MGVVFEGFEVASILNFALEYLRGWVGDIFSLISLYSLLNGD